MQQRLARDIFCSLSGHFAHFSAFVLLQRAQLVLLRCQRYLTKELHFFLSVA